MKRSPIQSYLSGEDAMLRLAGGALDGAHLDAARKAGELAPEVRFDLVATVEAQYLRSGLKSPSMLEHLLDPTSRTVTAGHQLVLATGPAFSIYKALTAVALAEHLAERWGTPVVPVFWLASEDHDFEEIRTLEAGADGQQFSWDGPEDMRGGRWPVGRMPVEGVSEVLASFSEAAALPEAWSAGLRDDLLDEQGELRSLADAFRRWMHRALGDVPIVVLDADAEKLKRHFAPIMGRELKGQGIEAAVLRANADLEKAGFKPQAHVRPVNLFEFRGGERVRVEAVGEPLGGGKGARVRPENFSPNALLRPMYQRAILPDVATVGGPSETAYWLQLREAFSSAGWRMPVLVPRHSCTVLTPKLAQLAEQLELNSEDLFAGRTELERRLVTEKMPEHWETQRRLLVGWIGQTVGVASDVDPGLDQAAQGMGARINKEFDKLEQKLRRAVKQQASVTVGRLERWSEGVAPGGRPQERVHNYFELAAAWNPDDLGALRVEILSVIRDSIARDFAPEQHVIQP
ncbi:MAG: bacillithiol biosynthesis cysteine-adding enzyme BshC [Flavobacteriales bacterium]|nr:bacillithiol biosynthesis cysteine-adding enzyme BshC [Flavobacteriales bacterium]